MLCCALRCMLRCAAHFNAREPRHIQHTARRGVRYASIDGRKYVDQFGECKSASVTQLHMYANHTGIQEGCLPSESYEVFGKAQVFSHVCNPGHNHLVALGVLNQVLEMEPRIGLD